MKKFLHDTLKEITHKHIIRFKTENGYTHAKMAELLAMDTRSYIELDHGKIGCSALTIIMFLNNCCTDVLKFLTEVKIAFESEDADIA